MRHRKKGNHLGRTASHKKALMRNLAAQVFEHKEIRTTVAKAKELRGYVERLITYGKKGTLHHRRLAFQFLQNKQAVNTLFNEIAPTYEDRAGGYTRIIRLGTRKGDNAEISIFQLVGFEKVQANKEEKKKKAKKGEEAVSEEVSKTTAEKKKETADKAVESKSEQTEVKQSAAPEAKEEINKENPSEEKVEAQDEKSATDDTPSSSTDDAKPSEEDASSEKKE